MVVLDNGCGYRNTNIFDQGGSLHIIQNTRNVKKHSLLHVFVGPPVTIYLALPILQVAELLTSVYQGQLWFPANENFREKKCNI